MKEIILANQKIIKEFNKETSTVIISGETAKRNLLTVTNDYKTFCCGNENGLSLTSAKPFKIDKFINYINLTPDQSLVAEKIEKANVLEGEVWKLTVNGNTSFYWFY